MTSNTDDQKSDLVYSDSFGDTLKTSEQAVKQATELTSDITFESNDKISAKSNSSELSVFNQSNYITTIHNNDGNKEDNEQIVNNTNNDNQPTKQQSKSDISSITDTYSNQIMVANSHPTATVSEHASNKNSDRTNKEHQLKNDDTKNSHDHDYKQHIARQTANSQTQTLLQNSGLDKLKCRIVREWQENGFINQLRSTIRCQLVSDLQNYRNLFQNQPNYRKKITAIKNVPIKDRIVNSLILDHLRKKLFNYSLSVFLAEIGGESIGSLSIHDTKNLIDYEPKYKNNTTLNDVPQVPTISIFEEIVQEFHQSNLESHKKTNNSKENDDLNTNKMTKNAKANEVSNAELLIKEMKLETQRERLNILQENMQVKIELARQQTKLLIEREFNDRTLRLENQIQQLQTELREKNQMIETVKKHQQTSTQQANIQTKTQTVSQSQTQPTTQSQTNTTYQTEDRSNQTSQLNSESIQHTLDRAALHDLDSEWRKKYHNLYTQFLHCMDKEDELQTIIDKLEVRNRSLTRENYQLKKLLEIAKKHQTTRADVIRAKMKTCNQDSRYNQSFNFNSTTNKIDEKTDPISNLRMYSNSQSNEKISVSESTFTKTYSQSKLASQLNRNTSNNSLQSKTSQIYSGSPNFSIHKENQQLHSHDNHIEQELSRRIRTQAALENEQRNLAQEATKFLQNATNNFQQKVNSNRISFNLINNNNNFSASSSLTCSKLESESNESASSKSETNKMHIALQKNHNNHQNPESVADIKHVATSKIVLSSPTERENLTYSLPKVPMPSNNNSKEQTDQKPVRKRSVSCKIQYLEPPICETEESVTPMPPSPTDSSDSAIQNNNFSKIEPRLLTTSDHSSIDDADSQNVDCNTISKINQQDADNNENSKQNTENDKNSKDNPESDSQTESSIVGREKKSSREFDSSDSFAGLEFLQNGFLTKYQQHIEKTLDKLELDN